LPGFPDVEEIAVSLLAMVDDKDAGKSATLKLAASRLKQLNRLASTQETTIVNLRDDSAKVLELRDTIQSLREKIAEYDAHPDVIEEKKRKAVKRVEKAMAELAEAEAEAESLTQAK